MAEKDFDYGTEEQIAEAGVFKQPAIGDHTARLRSLIHIGLCSEEFKGEVKKPAPMVVAVFELKDDEDFEDDGVTPLYLTKPFPLKKGDKAFMTKFLKALDPTGSAEGFDDLIGAACTVNAKPSKQLNDDGTPKYVNFGGLSGLPTKFASMVSPISGKSFGHLRFDDITKEAILELNPITEVANLLMKGVKYKGSKAEAIINEIRKETPDFAKPKAKEDNKEAPPTPDMPPPPDMDEDVAF